MAKENGSVVEHVPFWTEFVAGWVGGVGRVMTAQPFDIIKTRLQTQCVLEPIYSGTVDCFKKIKKEEGLLAFYKGTATPLLGVGTITACQFMAFNQTRNFLEVFGIFPKL
jgi:solute carrier family 25 carnitine/acylcarnitine transporter 20/29